MPFKRSMAAIRTTIRQVGGPDPSGHYAAGADHQFNQQCCQCQRWLACFRSRCFNFWNVPRCGDECGCRCSRSLQFGWRQCVCRWGSSATVLRVVLSDQLSGAMGSRRSDGYDQRDEWRLECHVGHFGTIQLAWIVLTHFARGRYSLVTSENPAVDGEVVLLYGTGLGPVSNTPVDGTEASDAPLSPTQNAPQVSIGGQTASVLWAGLAPGFVGLYQINVQVPMGLQVQGNIMLWRRLRALSQIRSIWRSNRRSKNSRAPG